MRFLSALVIKFVMVTTVLWIVLGMFGVSFGDILLTSVLLTIISLIGDMFVLPRIGNVAATIADVGLAFVLIWLVGSFIYEQPVRVVSAAFISAIILAVGEFLFHKYMKNQFFASEKPRQENNLTSFQEDNLQTEFGTEFDIEEPVQKKPSKLDAKGKSKAVIRPKKRRKKNPY